MNKEEWDSIKNQEEITIKTFHDYYLERGGLITDITAFEKLLMLILQNNMPLRTESGPKLVTFESMIKNLYEYYTKKFQA